MDPSLLLIGVIVVGGYLLYSKVSGDVKATFQQGPLSFLGLGGSGPAVSDVQPVPVDTPDDPLHVVGEVVNPVDGATISVGLFAQKYTMTAKLTSNKARLVTVVVTSQEFPQFRDPKTTTVSQNVALKVGDQTIDFTIGFDTVVNFGSMPIVATVLVNDVSVAVGRFNIG